MNSLQAIEEVYSVYCGISLADGSVSITETTITWQSQQLSSWILKGGNTTYGIGATYYNNINAFFNTIYGGKKGNQTFTNPVRTIFFDVTSKVVRRGAAG